jgi:hypothetical protein
MKRCSFRKGNYNSKCYFCDKKAEGVLDCDFPPQKDFEVFACQSCAKIEGKAPRTRISAKNTPSEAISHEKTPISLVENQTKLILGEK